MKMSTFLTFLFSIIFSSSLGDQRQCGFYYQNLDAAITVDSGRQHFDVIYSIFIGAVPGVRRNGVLFITKPSEYFMMDGNDVIMRSCPPVGVDVVLEFRIEDEPLCRSAYLAIYVSHTVPIFRRRYPNPEITVPCDGSDTLEVMTIEFENQGPCNPFTCTIECLDLLCIGKLFWIMDGYTVITKLDDIIFGFIYPVVITCVDPGLIISPPPKGSYAVKEIPITFQMLESCLTTTSTPQTTISTPHITISTGSRSQTTMQLTTPVIQNITSSTHNMTSTVASTMRKETITLPSPQTTSELTSTKHIPIHSSTLYTDRATTIVISKPTITPTSMYPSTLNTDEAISTFIPQPTTTPLPNDPRTVFTYETTTMTMLKPDTTPSRLLLDPITVLTCETTTTTKPQPATTQILTDPNTLFTDDTSKVADSQLSTTAIPMNPSTVFTDKSTSSKTLNVTSSTIQSSRALQTYTTPSTKSKLQTVFLTIEQSLGTMREANSTYYASLSTQTIRVSPKLMVSATQLPFSHAHSDTQTVPLTPHSPKMTTPIEMSTSMYTTAMSTSGPRAPSSAATTSSTNPTTLVKQSSKPTVVTPVKITRLTASSMGYIEQTSPSSIFTSPSGTRADTTLTVAASVHVTQTTLKPSSIYRFFDKPANIVAVSTVLGVLLLSGVISTSFIIWAKCCKTNSVDSWSDDRKTSSRTDNNGKVSFTIP